MFTYYISVVLILSKVFFFPTFFNAVLDPILKLLNELNTVIKLETLPKHQRESKCTWVRFSLLPGNLIPIQPIKILVSIVNSFVAKEEGA